MRSQTLGFVQADPIRAPARAQDLTLRHRVDGYRAGDLERLYPTLAIEEDAFVNYGFLPRAHLRADAPAHPRERGGDPTTRRRAEAVLEFVRERGEAHPRDVDAHFAHGAVRNYWGGSSNATTHLLDGMHYRGLLRVARRDNGIRVYAARELQAERLDAATRRARLDALADIVDSQVRAAAACKPQAVVRRLRYGTPQWRSGLGSALARARKRLAHAHVDGVDWYWPAGEDPRGFSAARRRIACACSRRSIPLSGTVRVSSSSGTGHTASKRTRRLDCGSSATTRCRSCGATRSSDGRTFR